MITRVLKLCFILFDSSPRTFRIITTTNTRQTKYDYGQLPLQQADTNNRKMPVLKLLVLCWIPLRARLTGRKLFTLCTLRIAKSASPRFQNSLE